MKTPSAAPPATGHEHNTSPSDIATLQPRQIFVFGSNLAGRHSKGAALRARKFGAKEGQGTGFAGQTYAIATKDKKLRILPLDRIAAQIPRFMRFVAEHPDLDFLLTPIGCGLAHYKPRQIAELFEGYNIPGNLHLPASFWRHLDSKKK